MLVALVRTICIAIFTSLDDEESSNGFRLTENICDGIDAESWLLITFLVRAADFLIWEPLVKIRHLQSANAISYTHSIVTFSRFRLEVVVSWPFQNHLHFVRFLHPASFCSNFRHPFAVSTLRSTMVDISNLILKALHRLTLFLFGLYYTFKIWWNRSKDRMSLQQLLDLTKQGHFKRIPKHLAFIANLEDYEYISDFDLVKLICWAILVQIPYVSVHDPDGFLKRRQKAILNRVREYLMSQFIDENDIQLKPGNLT